MFFRAFEQHRFCFVAEASMFDAVLFSIVRHDARSSWLRHASRQIVLPDVSYVVHVFEQLVSLGDGRLPVLGTPWFALLFVGLLCGFGAQSLFVTSPRGC